jgi:hypothetical protein
MSKWSGGERSSVSFDPFGRSADLAHLAADGFELELTQAGHLLVRHVPYRTPAGAAAYGTIVSKIEMNGDIAVTPVPDHTIWFVGQLPCDGLNQPLKGVIESRTQEVEPGLAVDHRLSCKRNDGQPYADNYEKVTAYIGLWSRRL